jgi:hypothetical protein
MAAGSGRVTSPAPGRGADQRVSPAMPPAVPPVPGGPLVGAPPIQTPGVLPGTDSLPGLPGGVRGGRDTDPV